MQKVTDNMAVLRQRRQAMTNPWLGDAVRKRSYQDVLNEGTRELRRDTEIIMKATMDGNFDLKGTERIEIPGVRIAYRSAPRQEMPGAFTEARRPSFSDTLGRDNRLALRYSNHSSTPPVRVSHGHSLYPYRPTKTEPRT
jgi:hypothetical protein